MIDDYRWKAADTVMRKSMAALQALRAVTGEQALARTHTHRPAGSAPEPADNALVIETERAMEKSCAALESFKEADGGAN